MNCRDTVIFKHPHTHSLSLPHGTDIGSKRTPSTALPGEQDDPPRLKCGYATFPLCTTPTIWGKWARSSPATKHGHPLQGIDKVRSVRTPAGSTYWGHENAVMFLSPFLETGPNYPDQQVVTRPPGVTTSVGDSSSTIYPKTF